MFENKSNCPLFFESFFFSIVSFEVENIDLKEISRLMRNNETIYDMYADKTENKFTEKKRKLSLYPKDKLPQYVQNHESKFKDWLD